MFFRKDAGKPICQSKEAELERKRKALTTLPVVPGAVSGVEYALGNSEHKLTVITSLQGLSPVFHQTYILMNYCFKGKLEIYTSKKKKSNPGLLCFPKIIYKFGLYF